MTRRDLVLGSPGRVREGRMEMAIAPPGLLLQPHLHAQQWAETTYPYASAWMGKAGTCVYPAALISELSPTSEGRFMERLRVLFFNIY